MVRAIIFDGRPHGCEYKIKLPFVTYIYMNKITIFLVTKSDWYTRSNKIAYCEGRNLIAERQGISNVQDGVSMFVMFICFIVIIVVSRCQGVRFSQ